MCSKYLVPHQEDYDISRPRPMALNLVHSPEGTCGQKHFEGALVIVVALLVLAFGVGRLSAAPGTLDSPAPPGSTSSYTLEDIYNRLDTGTAGTQSTFTEPTSGPTVGTMHTLNEIYDLIGQRAPVPKTGQTRSYATGDDGNLEKGVAWPSPRFTDNGDGTVTDNLTGLIWLKNANCFGIRAWAQALADANGLGAGYCGLVDGSSAGDWHLPNVRELHSLVHYGVYDPAVPNAAGTGQWTEGDPFTAVQSGMYWSSSTYAGYSGRACVATLIDGGMGASVKDYSMMGYVWPVRGGQ
jgi:hypothetical protein